MDFKDIEEVKVWIIKNQLGRRNLNDAERIKIAKKIMENKSQSDPSSIYIKTKFIRSEKVL